MQKSFVYINLQAEYVEHIKTLRKQFLLADTCETTAVDLSARSSSVIVDDDDDDDDGVCNSEDVSALSKHQNTKVNDLKSSYGLSPHVPHHFLTKVAQKTA